MKKKKQGSLVEADQSTPPVFLLTYFPWDSPTGGACIVRYLIENCHDINFVWVSLSRPSGVISFDVKGVTKEYFYSPNWGNVRLGLGKFWKWYYQKIWSHIAVRRLKRRIHQAAPKVVWIIADFTLVPVALRLLKKLRSQRIHISVHDHLYDTANRERVTKSFLHEVDMFQNYIEDKNISIDSVSEELAESVAAGVLRKAIITLPVTYSVAAENIIAPKQEGTLLIGLSGNFWGEDEFQCFVLGLDIWSKRSGRDWKLIVFGRSPEIMNKTQIEARGYVPVDRVRVELRNCDILLLPLPVDGNSLQMATSLPTKLVTYLEAGRLVLAFAPNRSVTERIIKEASIGKVVTRLDPEEVASQVTQLVNLDIEKAEGGRLSLLQGRFSEERILREFNEIMN